MIKEFFLFFFSFTQLFLARSNLDLYPRQRTKKKGTIIKSRTMLWEDARQAEDYFNIGRNLSEQFKQEFYQHLRGNDQLNSGEKRN